MNRIPLVFGLMLLAITLTSCSDDSTTEPSNTAPVISALTAVPTTVEIGATISITCTASDADSDDLTYAWTSTEGSIVGTDATVTWTAPATVGAYSVSCTVSDGDETDVDTVEVTTFETVVPGTMVAVTGGTFSMGDAYDEGPAWERPVHNITVGSYSIGKYEVTQGEWDDYMTAATYDHGVSSTHPVYYASWFEIILYCNYKSLDEGLTPCYSISGSTNPADWSVPPIYSTDTTFPDWNAATCNWSADGYRLPTEAEWEYAARGGADAADNFRYSGGQTLDDVAWYGDNATASMAVGTRLPNQLGLYDMSGNLYEFCWDWYAADYYTTCDGFGTVTDPTGPGLGDMRLVKGGDWSGTSANCRVAGRFRDYPVSAFSHTGFRLARRP